MKFISLLLVLPLFLVLLANNNTVNSLADNNANDNECKAPDCYPMTDGDGNANDNECKAPDCYPMTDGDGNGNDGKDKSETNSKDNDPCDYHGRDICDKSKKGCDAEHFDCLTDLDNGNYCTTGMCPGDDEKNNGNKNDNDNGKKSDGNSNSNDKSKSKSNSKSNDANTNIKKFKVNVLLDNTTEAEALQFQMRVIVYGPHALNKPTLDKPGAIVNIGGCVSSCYTTWDFTAWKVPVGSQISACVWNNDTGHQTCGYGKSHSQYGPETIHISLPSSSYTDSQTTTSNPSKKGTNDSQFAPRIEQKTIPKTIIPKSFGGYKEPGPESNLKVEGSEFTEYSNPQMSMKLNFSADWLVKDSGNGLLVTFRPPQTNMSTNDESLKIKVIKIPPANFSLALYLPKYIGLLRLSHQIVSINATNNITIFGQNGFSLLYNKVVDNIEYSVMQDFITYGQTLYVFTYNSPKQHYQKYLTNVKDMIESIRLTTVDDKSPSSNKQLLNQEPSDQSTHAKIAVTAADLNGNSEVPVANTVVDIISSSENVTSIGQTYRLWIYVHNAITIGKEVDFHTLLFNSKNNVFSDKVFDVEQTIRDFEDSLVPVDFYKLTNKKDLSPDQLRVCVHLSHAASDTDASHCAGPTLVEKGKYQVDFDYNVLLDDLR